jgi:hypothetical protein
MPIWCNGGSEIVAVIALTLDVEPNIRVGRVHDTVATDLIFTGFHCSAFSW